MAPRRPAFRRPAACAPDRGARLTDARFDIRVTPRASRGQIAGWREGVLHLKVTAPPADNAANAAVIDLLASALDIPKRSVEIVRGHTSRMKHVRVEGLSLDDVRARLLELEG